MWHLCPPHPSIRSTPCLNSAVTPRPRIRRTKHGLPHFLPTIPPLRNPKKGKERQRTGDLNVGLNVRCGSLPSIFPPSSLQLFLYLYYNNLSHKPDLDHSMPKERRGRPSFNKMTDNAGQANFSQARTHTQKRNRYVLHACDRCRTAKVRCDGGLPCGYCVRRDRYTCYYSSPKFQSESVHHATVAAQ
jgi:hypothetical protein